MLRSCLKCAPELSGARILTVLTARGSSGLAVKIGCSLVAARWQVFYVSLLSSLRNQGSLAHILHKFAAELMKVTTSHKEQI